ncbi:MAG: AI-2E family transporter [bacterium]|nr:AI-2E family transporter [bacterium]
MAEPMERRKEADSIKMSITAGSWVRGIAVVALALALFTIRDIILIILTAIVIASAVEPAALWAKRYSIPRIPTILAVYVTLALIFVGLFYFLFIPLLGETSNFIASFPQYSNALITDIGAQSEGGLLKTISNSVSVEEIVNKLNSTVGSFSKGVFSSVSIIFGGAISFLLIVILSFYLAVQEDGVGKFLKAIVPWKQEKYILGLWERSKTKIGLWMQGQLLLAAIIFVLVYLGLLLLGIENALLLAVLAGVLEIIPIFGPIIAAIPAILIGFTQGGTSVALTVAGLFLIIQQFENQLIYPLVVKKVVGVPPMISILAILIGGQLAGFLGVLISVPIATVIIELIDDLEERKIAQVSEIKKSAS